MVRKIVAGALAATFIIGVAGADSLPPQTIKPAGQEAPNAQAVQGVTGGVPIPVQGVAGATSDVTLHDNTTPAQHLGIDAAGKAATAPAVATAAAPTYGEGAIVSLSTDLAGALRVGAGAGLTDTQLRASAVPVSVSGVATAAKQDTGNTSLASIDGKLTNPLPVSAASLPLPSGAATSAKQDLAQTTLDLINADTGSINGKDFATSAKQTDGTQKAINRGGAKGATVAADITSTANGADHQGLDVQVQNASIAVTGTVTTTPPSNASTNVTQWNGTTVDTNSGVKSAGTVRVVLATDQPALTNKLLVTPDSVALPANQSVNVAQLAGTTTDTNSGVKSAGTLRVVLATDQPALTNKLLVTPDSVALPANQSVNLAQVGGTNTVNGGLAGSLSVGGTAGNNAAITQNPVLVALEARSSTPTAATNGNQIRSAGDLAGNQFNVFPIAWSCELDNIAATLTQCQAAPGAGFSLYVTSVIANSTTATGGTFSLRQGTGSNCGTGTDNVIPGGAGTARTYALPANTAAPFLFSSPSGVKLTAANALCGIGVATNTLNVVVSGYTAP